MISKTVTSKTPALAGPSLLVTLLFALALLGGCDGSSPAGTEGSRVIVLGIDGLDPEVVQMLVDEGQLPNFARLIEGGVFGEMYSPPPLLSPIIWTTLATGRRPSDHGIGHFTTLDPVTGEELPVISTLRRTKALWNLFSEAGRRVAVVGWWATWPAEEVEGLMVSDHAGYHFLMGDQRGDGEPGTVWPAERQEEILAQLGRPEDLTHDQVTGFVDVSAEDFDTPFDFDDDLSHFKWALTTARGYRELGLDLWRQESPDLLMVYFEGVDSTSHLFGHLFRQQSLAGELADQQQRFGGTVEAMYRLADDVVGRYLAVLDDDTTLVVVSDHGFQLGELLDDPSKSRDMRRVSEEFHRTQASLFLYGAGVDASAEWRSAQTLDFTPTVLALAGLPAAEDMPGRVLHEVLDGPQLSRIETYEGSGPGARGSDALAEGRTEGIDAAVLERLRSLGYLGSGGVDTTTNDRNLASILLREGEYREAARSFRALLDENPEDASLHTGLATAFAGLGRHDQAFEAYDLALELDPLFSPARFNRGLLHERLGDLDAAIADFRTTLRYQADHGPSTRALARLGMATTERVASNEAEVRAQLLLREARGLAQRGDYAAADARLEEAERLAPQAAVVLQYRSNVAYLQGDHQAAIEHLEKALVLEPDNPLLVRNLQRLRADDGGANR